MKAPARLGLYGLVLAVVFAAAFAIAGAVVPEATVQNWVEESTDEHEGQTEATSSLGLAQDGYRLSGLSTTEGVGAVGELSLTVTGPDGKPDTSLEPYLGADGHMVALPEGDLAYLHVHPHGEEPRAGENSKNEDENANKNEEEGGS